MPNQFPEAANAVAPALDVLCCFDQCPPLWELEDNQFLALVYYVLSLNFGVPPASATAGEIQDNAKNAWCTFNQLQLCSIPPDKLKAMILWQLNQALI